MADITLNKITGDIVESYTNQDLSLIPAFDSVSQFNPKTDRVEFSIYDEQGLLRHFNPTYTSYRVILNYNNVTNSVSTVTVDPEEDLKKEGYDQGRYTVYYNFLRDEISSSLEFPFFVTQISSDKTEIKISSNNLNNEELQESISTFTDNLNDSPYFEDFRLDFGNNITSIANNILLDTTNPQQYSVLVKLYEALPDSITIKDSLTICLQTADEVSYAIEFPPKVFTQPQPKKIGAPNFNINLADKSNNDTIYKSSDDILDVSLSSSYDEIQSILKSKGIKVNIDYSDFNNFVYFSSAEERVKNFYYKVGLIEGYRDEISVLSSLSTTNVSSSIIVLEQQISKIKENFDGYEKYQYYSSGSSDIYPKVNNTHYNLYSAQSIQAKDWLDTQISSASSYDVESVDRLVNSLPEYVQSDERNSSFLLFMDMVGQHFDNIWIHIKDISKRYDGDNRLNRGISKDVVRDALTSMGVNTYQNNLSEFDLATALTDKNSKGGLGIPSGSEEINTVTLDIADPGPKEDAIKGVYKRIFHNLPFLLKKKGSVEGLRALINTFGIPESILRISEYGGYKADENRWKMFKEVSNFGMTGGRFQTDLTLGPKWGSDLPGGVFFRIKWISGSLPPNNTNHTLANFGSDVVLTYTGGAENSGSYEGSIASGSWTRYRGALDINNGSNSVKAPFFNGEWWTIGINNKNTAVIGSNVNHGNDGFKIVYKGNGLPGNSVVSGEDSTIYGNTVSNDNKFIFQELRFYKESLNVENIHNLIMNPLSLDTGLNNLAFRAPLGSDLNTVSSATDDSYVSIHPRSTTGSGDPEGVIAGGEGSFKYYSFAGSQTYSYVPSNPPDFVENNEFVYYKEPVVGIKNRVSYKIREENPIITGTTLNNLSSIQQKALNTVKEVPDVHFLEVGFSPQNEINDDIAASYANNFDLGFYIGDPSKFEIPAETSYLALSKESETYFQKYSSPYDWKDYIRLIKYFDGSLFKMIKDFTPARSSLASGIIIKQHLLERNKHNPALVSISSHSYESIIPQIGNFEGGGGGVFNAINGLDYYWSGSEFNSLGDLITGSKPYPPSDFTPTPFVSQSWQENILTKVGPLKITHDTQEEFYNGELGGSKVTVTNGNLNTIDIREKGTNGSFVAPYDTTNANVYGGTTSNGVIRYYTDGNSTLDSFRIGRYDSDSEDRSNYYNNITNGTPLTIQTLGTFPGTATFISTGPAVYNFGSGGNFYSIAVEPYPLQDLPSDFINGVVNGANFESKVIYNEDLVTNTTLLSDSPILNNVSRNRESSIFMDVDYSSNPEGDGILIPVNIGQIIEGNAIKAPVQDSNYSSTSWANSRYKGTKVSSVGFNVQGFKE